MVSFYVYDIAFLVVFTIFITWFLSTHKKGLSREGAIFMYRTQVGVKAINYVGKKFKKTLQFLKYIIITVGFALMGIMMWMLGQTVVTYIAHPEITEAIKAPPIAPLIPYFPKLFGMESIFPPFYFTYFILALAVVAISHEFSHGIYMKLFKVKIKSTGFIFLGPILGAFVEEQKSGFYKKKNSEQMAILGAGVFANVVMAILFYIIYVLFFAVSFTPSGALFNTYGLASIPLESITSFSQADNNLTLVQTATASYYLDENLKSQLEMSGLDFLVVYHKAPAIELQMEGAIIQAENVRIKSQDDLVQFLKSTEPGDTIKIITETDDGYNEYYPTLTENPSNSSKGYLGIGYSITASDGIIREVLTGLMSFKEVGTYYKTTWDGDTVYFIYYLLWWIMVINLLVALFNMMPLGMLDGGRFFYLTILSITRSEKISKAAYKFATYAIALMFILLMFFWFIRIF